MVASEKKCSLNALLWDPLCCKDVFEFALEKADPDVAFLLLELGLHKRAGFDINAPDLESGRSMTLILWMTVQTAANSGWIDKLVAAGADLLKPLPFHPLGVASVPLGKATVAYLVEQSRRPEADRAPWHWPTDVAGIIVYLKYAFSIQHAIFFQLLLQRYFPDGLSFIELLLREPLLESAFVRVVFNYSWTVHDRVSFLSLVLELFKTHNRLCPQPWLAHSLYCGSVTPNRSSLALAGAIQLVKSVLAIVDRQPCQETTNLILEHQDSILQYYLSGSDAVALDFQEMDHILTEVASFVDFKAWASHSRFQRAENIAPKFAARVKEQALLANISQ